MLNLNSEQPSGMFGGGLGLSVSKELQVVTEKRGPPYIKTEKNSLMNAEGGGIPWKRLAALFRMYPRCFNRFHGLRGRAKGVGYSLKSLVGDLVRSRTVQTNHKRGDLVKNHLLQPYLAIRGKMEFESKPQILYMRCFTVWVELGRRKASIW